MMTPDSQEGRVCPFCREPVKAGAKKCPHCHQRQGRWAFLYHPAAMVALLMVPFVGFSLITRHEFGTKENFSKYRDQILVRESSMHYSAADDKCGPTISVVGTIRNNSAITWKDVYLEARYFDAGGKMIDTNGAQQYGLVIPPHGDVAFRIRGPADRAEQDYASHTVFVRSARDARSLF